MDHKQARQIIIEAFVAVFGRVPTQYEAQAAQGIAWLETRYGTAWLGAGVGSRNWGAVTRSKPPCDTATSFLYTDSAPQGDGTNKTYSVCFKKYLTDELAAADLINIAFGSRFKPKGALAPATAGDLYGVSAALRAQSYYLGFGATRTEQIANHYKALSAAVHAQYVALNEPMPGSAATFKTVVGKVLGSIVPLKASTLHRGDRGPEVKAWQMVLNQLGAHLACDGIFGPATETATVLFQGEHGLTLDGLVGNKTRAAASAALKRVKP